jgi:mRNA interferase MazF
MVISRFEVHLVALAPTVGRAIRKTRPCLVVSPDEMNHNIRTSIVAPMTTKGRGYPTRVSCRFGGKTSQIVLDRIRTVDQARLVKKLGRIDAPTAERVLGVLQEMFAR